MAFASDLNWKQRMLPEESPDGGGGNGARAMPDGNFPESPWKLITSRDFFFVQTLISLRLFRYRM